MSAESSISVSFFTSLQQKLVLPFLLDILVLFWELDFATNPSPSLFSYKNSPHPGTDLTKITATQIVSKGSLCLNSDEPRIEPPSLYAMSPGIPLVSFVQDDPLLCLVCGLSAGISCPDCEENFCCRHVYQCHQCQITFCGDCFDIHADDGHWSDSVAAAMFDASSRLQHYQFMCRPPTCTDSIVGLPSSIAGSNRQAPASHAVKIFLRSAIRRLLPRVVGSLLPGLDCTLATEASQ